MNTNSLEALDIGVHARHPVRGERAFILLLVGFLLIFPKGGIKLAGVPVTWGYLALALAAFPFLLGVLSRQSGGFTRVRLVPIALLLPFQLVVVLALLLNGSATLGFSISLVVTFFFLPLIFVLVLGFYLDGTDIEFVLRLVRIGVLAVAVYGIFLFVFKLQTGRFIEIPFLTVNAGDVGSLEDKFIDRGGIFKLISTYNNGNIYGVSLLILLPLYAWLEPSLLAKSVVKLSLLLTLSRTVWVGLLLFELVHRLYVQRLSVRTLTVLLCSVLLFALGVWYALDLMGRGGAFLLDRNLGGRIGQLASLESISIFPVVEFAGITEIVYLSVLYNFGLLGLVLFLVGLATPMILHFLRVLPHGHTSYKRSLSAGLILYLVVAMSDGAILYIPVMAMYWFVVSLLLSNNIPGTVPADLGKSLEQLPMGAARRRTSLAPT